MSRYSLISLLEEGFTPRNPNASPVQRRIVDAVVEYIIEILLPSIFDFIHNKFKIDFKNRVVRKINSTKRLRFLVNFFMDEYRKKIKEENQIYLSHNMIYYLKPSAHDIIISLIRKGLLSNQRLPFIQWIFETNEKNIFEDKRASKTEGETEYADYYLDTKYLAGKIKININEAINFNFYTQYINGGKSGLWNAVFLNGKIKDRLSTTIRHEMQHAHQMYNLCVFNFQRFVNKKENEDGIVTPEDISEVFYKEISNDNNSRKGFTYFDEEAMSKLATMDNKNLNIKPKKKREYYYHSTEAPVRLIDFVIAYVQICRNYLNTHEDMCKLVIGLCKLKTGRAFLKVHRGYSKYIMKIVENARAILPDNISTSTIEKLIDDLVDNEEITYNFPFIEDIITNSDTDFAINYIKKLTSYIEKEYDLPSL